MKTPQTLSRPLAQRVAGLDDPRAPIATAPDLPASVLDAACSALDRGETHYTDRPGIPEFRAWVADHLRERYAISVDPSEVTITCGSTEARFVCMTRLAPPGSAVLCPGDASRIRGAADLVGASIVDSIQDDISLLYITPDDYRETSIELLQRAEENGWWIVYDLSFAATSAPFHPAQNEKLASRVVTINALSGRLAGWRLGWMAGSEMALRLRAGKQAITICTTAVSQWAGLEWVRTQI
ncbi:MAG: aminotransferase class I/II-fold pyridoxal phosphate-dependent enzyme [Chloroflexota bacterium]|nr:aminotransferase class I/II-fold pyridoxal phosphate-dependent enzyme [Chloroflexota bacterium]MDE2945601.1 aminotransferase class I/II-fold pyridoxal phosphate-dependent enzyme [Chloroflexota bacterium]